jgi:hypothetical protein
MPKDEKKRPSRSKYPDALPKGAFPLPNGNYVTTSISEPDARGRRIRIRAVHRAEPDLKLLAQALIAQAEQMARESKNGQPDQGQA